MHTHWKQLASCTQIEDRIGPSYKFTGARVLGSYARCDSHCAAIGGAVIEVVGGARHPCHVLEDEARERPNREHKSGANFARAAPRESASLARCWTDSRNRAAQHLFHLPPAVWMDQVWVPTWVTDWAAAFAHHGHEHCQVVEDALPQWIQTVHRWVKVVVVQHRRRVYFLICFIRHAGYLFSISRTNTWPNERDLYAAIGRDLFHNFICISRPRRARTLHLSRQCEFPFVIIGCWRNLLLSKLFN